LAAFRLPAASAGLYGLRCGLCFVISQAAIGIGGPDVFQVIVVVLIGGHGQPLVASPIAGRRERPASNAGSAREDEWMQKKAVDRDAILQRIARPRTRSSLFWWLLVHRFVETNHVGGIHFCRCGL